MERIRDLIFENMFEDSPMLHDALLELIYGLPEYQRHVILLKYPLDFSSLSYSDARIGMMLRISATWVKTLRERAFTNLRREVKVLNLR